jgi:FkbM family methyltransferase
MGQHVQAPALGGVDSALVERLLLRCPGVARVRVRQDADGTPAADILPWSQPDDGSAAGTVAELAQVNPHETRFLHDEIFIAQAYLQGGVVLREDAIVFDVGANIGMFGLFVGARCPSATVYAFEPVLDIAEPLRRNAARHGAPVTVFPFGLSNREQEVTFNFYPGISIMSCRSDYADLDNEVDLIKRYVDNAREHGPSGREEHLAQVAELVSRDFELSERACRLRRLSSVLRETGVPRIDLLKIDVQRAELDVLLGIDESDWPLVRQISMEVHDEPGTPTEGRVAQVRQLLTAHGYLVTVAEEDLLAGTGRYAVQAVAPDYQQESRPVVAAAGTVVALDPERVGAWLSDRLPAGHPPVTVSVVRSLPVS